MGELFNRVTNSARDPHGVSVEVGETQAAVGLTVTVPYGRSIPKVAKEMRNNVIRWPERLAGLEGTEVDITVRDVSSPSSSRRSAQNATATTVLIALMVLDRSC